MIVKDTWGRELRVGDVCTYPVRRGSKMWMNRLTIHLILMDVAGNPQVKGLNQDGARVTLTSLQNLTLLGRDNVIPLEV